MQVTLGFHFAFSLSPFITRQPPPPLSLLLLLLCLDLSSGSGDLSCMAECALAMGEVARRPTCCSAGPGPDLWPGASSSRHAAGDSRQVALVAGLRRHGPRPGRPAARSFKLRLGGCRARSFMLAHHRGSRRRHRSGGLRSRRCHVSSLARRRFPSSDGPVGVCGQSAKVDAAASGSPSWCLASAGGYVGPPSWRTMARVEARLVPGAAGTRDVVA